MMVIQTEVNTLATVPKGLERGWKILEVRGIIATIQATALLLTARILRSVQQTLGDLLSHGLQ